MTSNATPKISSVAAFALLLLGAWDRWGLARAITAALGGAALCLLAFRPKARAEPDAIASQAADLLEGRHMFPGQLSVTPDAIVWQPSSYSLRKGKERAEVPRATCTVVLTDGPALLDLIVRIESPTGALTLGTRRSAALRRSLGT